MKDGWFQMFAAVGGVACVVWILGGVSPRSVPPPAPAAAPSMGAAPAALPEPAAAVASGAADGPITPPAPSSSDLATYSGVNSASRSPGALIAPPASSSPPPPQPAPQITLTGTGVGNTQGIVGAPGGMGGTLNAMINTLMSVQPGRAPLTRPGQAAQTAAMTALPPLFRVAPARAGVFNVGPPGMPGMDTSSLRDAVFSAANGDLILVKPGTYEGPVEVLNKSVRIRGTGSSPAAVTIRWTGSGATLTVRGGSLDLERLRVQRGATYESPKAEPGGAVYAIASTLTMRKVELESGDPSSPPLIAEQGDKPTRLAAEDSELSGQSAGLLIRGPVKAKLTRVTIHGTSRPIAAWIDAFIELADCVFASTGAEPLIYAYEGARVVVTGKRKPRIVTARGPESTAFEESFGVKRAGIASGGFSRDIFRRGRRAGTLP